MWKTSGKLPIILEEEFREYTLMYSKRKNRTVMSTCNWAGLDLETLGSGHIMPGQKSLPGHWAWVGSQN